MVPRASTQVPINHADIKNLRAEINKRMDSAIGNKVLDLG
jgi:hypothetical protein